VQRRVARFLGYPILVLAVLASAVGVFSVAPASAATTFDPHLTRAPYLTDLVGQHAMVSWATDRSATTGSLRWGPVTAGSCTLSNTQTASRFSLTVGSVSEYRWAVSLTLPGAGTYCYRPYLGASDLLAANATPRFVTQATVGDPAPFSFGVMGDWGKVDGSGNNADAANLMSLIAGSGLRFMLTVGDNGYPSGSQTNYGDLQQKGADTSAIFGPSFWTVPGSTVPIFTAVGNHGLSGTTHSDITNFPQDLAVSSSGGRYQNDTYCCVNGSTSSNYGSEWYAFDAGLARVYVLDAAWGDTNPGTADGYTNDAAAHWAQNAPEYQWLLHDLQAHPTGLKFAAFHYPMYSDNKSESSDVPLRNALEPLLKQYGVDVAFSGHAHIYQRNQPSSPGAPVTYVTGGGGGTLEPVDVCSSIDAYGIGWSPTKLKGYKCGAAPLPTAAAQVFHFLKVTVNGSSVTVAPTNSLGQTFDVQTYNFGAGAPDTVIDSAPRALSASTTASFGFHATTAPATFQCALDGGAFGTCSSPVSYSSLAAGSHTFAVRAVSSGGTDPTPATRQWTIDTTPPSAPTSPTATAISSTAVAVGWSAASDANGVAGYDVLRNGATVGSVGGSTLTFTDVTVAAGTTYQYTVKARDGAGNVSAASVPVSVTTPTGVAPIFADGFETGTLSAWTSSSGLAAQRSTVRSGSFAAEGATTNGATYAKKTLPATYGDGFGRVYFNLKSASSQVNLLRFRTAADGSLGYLFVTPTGQVGLRNDVAATTTMSSAVAGAGWHAIELHMTVHGTGSTIEVWLDGVRLSDISPSGVNLGTTPIGRLQIGEVQAARTYDVVFDDAAFGSARIGL
jgi:hypothetical protein